MKKSFSNEFIMQQHENIIYLKYEYISIYRCKYAISEMN